MCANFWIGVDPTSEFVCFKFSRWLFRIPNAMLFESNDIVIGGRDGGREVIICLMNLAKRFSIDYYVPAPETIKVEVENEIKIKSQNLSKNRMSNAFL